MSGIWIKICGLTTPEAVAAALAERVDAVGFVFSESPRQVSPQRAVQLAAAARGRARCVAVTRRPDQRLIDEIVEVFQPDVLQTDLDDLRSLRLPRRLEVLPVLRAGAGGQEPLPQRVLFEGPRSGSGALCDWSEAGVVARRVQLVLAGGLSSDNVAGAIAAVRPFGIDVSSGVEQQPGIKSPMRIARFVQAARAASQEYSS